jgi:hypothetical protein
MVPFIILGIVAIIFYYGFIKGGVFPLMLLFIGPFAGGALMIKHFPSTSKTLLTITPWTNIHYSLSWAVVLSFFIIVIGIGWFMRDV